MRVVTALRARGRGRVAVELDGAPWRTLPLEPVVRAGLAPGSALDRERARSLARELRRDRALGTAGRALRRRPLSSARLAERLVRAGVAPAGRREALETLERAGLVDDARLAADRAAALAVRGHGDAAIRWDLERQGVGGELVAEALAGLEPEDERAVRLASARGGGAAASRFLARRGFAEDSIEVALARIGAGGPASLG